LLFFSESVSEHDRQKSAQSRVLLTFVTESGISVGAVTVTGADVAVVVVGAAGTDVATGTTSGVTGGSAPFYTIPLDTYRSASASLFR